MFTTASVASRTSCSPPTALGKSRARDGRSSGASASPANHFRMACTARARRRSTSSSSCLASSRAARAWSDDGLKRVAHASRQWISDRSAGEEVSRKASSSRGAERPTLSSSARRTRASARRGTRSSVRKEIGENRACARPLARAPLSARRGERPTMPVAVGARRRQPKRVLAEFRGDDRGTAGARQGRSLLELGGDLRIWTLRREREVTGLVERVARDRCGVVRAHDAACPRGSTLVEHGREERVRKANRPGTASSMT